MAKSLAQKYAKILKDAGIVVGEVPKHGSPQDRGSADAYYGRRPNPHYWPKGTYKGEMVPKEEMTEDQITQYWYGYDTEDDRKNWR